MIRAFFAAALAFATPAVAVTTFNVADLASPAFSFGNATVSGNAITGFTPFGAITGNCAGVTGLTCRSDGSADALPGAFTNATGSTLNFATVSLPVNTLMLHPGSEAGENATVTFVAPRTTTYTINLAIRRLDNTTNGDGVLIGVGLNNFFAGYAPIANTEFNPLTVNGPIALSAGESLSFIVDRNGEYQFDSTGFSGSISYVPEPAAWALMIGGFGLVGGAARRRRVAFA